MTSRNRTDTDVVEEYGNAYRGFGVLVLALTTIGIGTDYAVGSAIGTDTVLGPGPYLVLCGAILALDVVAWLLRG